MKYNVCLILILLMNIISCKGSGIETIKIGHIGQFDYDIWMQINDEIKMENAQLELISFNDYEILNKALNDGEIDLNAFQNYIYFVNETNKYDYKLHILEKTFVAPMNIYSKFFTNINQIYSHAKIAIPNDDVNLSRALQILETAGLIKLRRSDKSFYKISNIIENPLMLLLVPMDASMIYDNMDRIDAAVINYGFISDYKNYKIIYHDDIRKYSHAGANSYVNLIVCRQKHKNYNIYRYIAASYKQKMKNRIEENKLKELMIVE